ncbi:sarcoplasmic calcium-binding protein, beta chain-like [Lingula anatina]|uniref:Sarcoplasmic calcium-binding protein, beta chain-like n=1 Tax=Lingula anatina TaxID=7574 RepID=A0A2R2MJW3_LINAN|nr:sarcoplasmic calcium-binding protein, beta chain-like [Lingula anatina]|eukprot:XP_023930488.1 sarcoplasmic calcium-binding protein, beta chain-like [Lingula anatina]
MLRAVSRVVPQMVRSAAANAPNMVVRPAAISLVRTMMEGVAKGKKLNQFQKSKLKRKFDLYDIDDDGFVEREDYDNYIAKIKEAYDLKDGDPLLRAFEMEFDAHWQKMLKFMDENKDGQLSIDEWLDYYPSITSTSKAKTPENLPRFSTM